MSSSNDREILAQISPSFDLEASFLRMKTKEEYVRSLGGTPVHRLYDIISSNDYWYIENIGGTMYVQLINGEDDRLLELGFEHVYGKDYVMDWNDKGASDIYDLRNHYHTREMYLLPEYKRPIEVVTCKLGYPH